MDTFKFGADDARKQRDQMKGDAKELANGSPLDSDDGGKLGSAGDMAKGTPAPSKGKTFGK
jgi:hypothetical protein